MTVSIYALINPLDQSVFYVGATKSPLQRLISHNSEKSNNSFKNEQIRKIKEADDGAEMFILEECDISEVKFLEEFYINMFLFYGFALKQLRYSTYTHPTDNSLPEFIKMERKKSVTYILRWRENGITREFKINEKNGDITDYKARDMLYKDYFNATALGR